MMQTRRLLRDGTAALAAVALLLEGCAGAPRTAGPSPSASVAAVEPPRPAPATATPAPKPKLCVPWDEADCREKCEHESAADCRQLWQFYTYYARGASESPHATPETRIKATEAFQRAVLLESQACDGGHLSACRELLDSSRVYPSLPSDVEARGRRRTNDLMQELHRTQVAACNTGDGDACLNAARQLGADRPTHVAPNRPEMMELLQRACDAGVADGCSDLSVRVKQDRTRSSDESLALSRRALVLRDEACRKGEQTACGKLGWALVRGNGVTSDPRRGFSLLRRSCEMGSEDTCREMVDYYLLAEAPAPTGLTGDEEKTGMHQLLRYQLELCKGGDARMCELLDPLRLDPPDLDDANVIARMFCQRYDYPGIDCHADTSYFNVFCRFYCEQGVGMHLPEP